MPAVNGLALVAAFILAESGQTPAALIVAALGVFVLASQTSGLTAYALQATHRFRAAGIAVWAPTALFLVALVGLRGTRSLTGVLLAAVLAQLLTSVVLGERMWRASRGDAAVDSELRARSLVVGGAPLMAANLSGGLAQSVDRLLVSWVVLVSQFALYGFAATVFYAASGAGGLRRVDLRIRGRVGRVSARQPGDYRHRFASDRARTHSDAHRRWIRRDHGARQRRAAVAWVAGVTALARAVARSFRRVEFRPMPRWGQWVRPLMRTVTRACERAGVHVVPVHFYSQQPNVQELERTRDIWARPSAMPAIAADPDAQIDALRRICLPYQREYTAQKTFDYATEHGFGRGYGLIEAEALHGFIRSYHPARIIEVGSGVSTYCANVAANINRREGFPCAITCIEPYPRDPLRGMPVTLIDRPVQTVSLDTFATLAANDILFIDSSHAVRVGSDVNYLFLEVIPRLAPGVLIHIHDIFLPYDYSPAELHALWFHWSETSLIRALLTGNARLEIVACLSQLHHERPTALADVFPDYHPRPTRNGLFTATTDDTLHFPSSLWLRVITS